MSLPAFKVCTENGTWWTDPKTNQEWTDYTECLETLVEGYKGAWITGIVCDAVSLSLLIPACLIFLGFRQLRRQQRIKLHLSLFLSFIVTSLVRLLWDTIIFYERMSLPAAETAMGKNTPGCILLYVLTRYARTTNFFWMLAEGFYLHRLIVKAFDVPKTLIPYYIFGWGASSIPLIIYSIIRATNGDAECWVNHAGALEWLVYTPNLLCLVLNLIILCIIIGIMMTGLQSHPNEPSTYRRALKAAFILVPLFGLQLFAVLYRPPQSKHSYIYEIVSKILKNLQGAAIALIFCFLNGEVLVHLKTALHRIKSDPYRSEFRSEFTQNMSMSTTVDASRPLRGDDSPTRPCKTYIPLNTIDEKGTEKQNGDI